MEQDSLLIAENSELETGFLTEHLYIVVIVVLLIVIALLLKKLAELNKEIRLSNFDATGGLKNSKNSDIDMSDVMNSINKAKPLYKELSRQYHPDRYQDSEKKTLATDFFQRISESRRNYSELKKIKEELENSEL